MGWDLEPLEQEGCLVLLNPELDYRAVRAGEFNIKGLQAVLAGMPLREAIEAARARGSRYLAGDFEKWGARDDFEVIGRILSPACYVEDAVPAVIHLARKYAADPEEGLVANTMVGGDNCYRGTVLGALLGAATGPEGWPERWREGLMVRPDLPLSA